MDQPKLTGFEFYETVLGSPRYVVAPMVIIEKSTNNLSIKKINKHFLRWMRVNLLGECCAGAMELNYVTPL